MDIDDLGAEAVRLADGLHICHGREKRQRQYLGF